MICGEEEGSNAGWMLRSEDKVGVGVDKLRTRQASEPACEMAQFSKKFQPQNDAKTI